MAASSSSGMSNEQIVARFNEMRQQVSSLTAKIADLEGDCQEHTLVINTLEPMGKERQCYRMIGDVLVERTVGEALPAVTRNRDNLQQAIDQLSKQRETTVKELSAFQVGG
jgi:prefoldin subunit 2